MDEKNINFENQENEKNTEPNEVIEPYKENEMSEDAPVDSQALEAEASARESNEKVAQEPISDPKDTSPNVIYRWDYHEQLKVDSRRASKKKKSGKLLYAGVLGVVFLFTMLLLVGALLLSGFSTSGNKYNTYGSISELYVECLPSYVALSVTTSSGEGTGSGIVITSDGYIATNYHVVENAQSITAIMSDGTTYDAEFIDGDDLNDIAVIKIEARGLSAAKLGSSENSRVGDQVMAIGTPHSINYRGTMTSGYISALNRRFVEQNANGTVNKVRYLIQTDTSVNPGNSGGPLFNMSGEVIGIVTLKIAGDNYEGLGFALPLESVINMINDIIENGEITDHDAGGAAHGAALGISGFTVTKDTKYLLSGEYHYTVTQSSETGEEVVLYPSIIGYIEIPLSDEEMLAEYDITDYSFFTAGATGILVVDTTEGFDSFKKLKINDIIVSANGISCKQMSALQSLIADKRIGDEIEFEVFRDGKTVSVTVELGKASSMAD